MTDKLHMTPAALSALVKGDFTNFMAAATPGGIEKQEADEQRALVNATTSRLPKMFLGVSALGLGINAFQSDPADKDLIKLLYGKMGIEVIGDYDDLFVNVKLSAGWKIKAAKHSMYSELFDDKGRERGGIFYKGAFYDRRADFRFTCRFTTQCFPEDDYRTEATYDERNKMKWYGRAYDSGKIIFQTEGFYLKPRSEYFQENLELQNKLQAEAGAWLIKQGYPEYKNPFMYWDL